MREYDGTPTDYGLAADEDTVTRMAIALHTAYFGGRRGWDYDIAHPEIEGSRRRVDTYKYYARSAYLAEHHQPSESIVRSVERILDECSAWISAPNRECAMRIALAATFKAAEEYGR